MAKYCTECGHELNPDELFCPSCGKAVNSEECDTSGAYDNTGAADPSSEENISVEKHDVIPPSVDNGHGTSHKDKNSAASGTSCGTIGTGTYFFLLLLYALPVVGPVACIVSAIAPKNASLKNFARAILLWMGIFIVLAAAACIAAYIFRAHLIELYLDLIKHTSSDVNPYIAEFFKTGLGININISI